MAKLSAALPQGTRDFGPETVRKRQYILNTIKAVFELYGFQPLETPAMENLDTLMGKYGEEGDKLIFKILNNGLSDPKNTEKAKKAFEKVLEGKNDRDLTERALRYDLTIPFARYVAMNQGQLTMPFKRYQVQPVWRADRPQKGRYREFYQCDADVVGSYSLLNEIELAAIYRQVFEQLGIEVSIRINNRKILAALAETCGGADKLTDITIAIDKLDKIGAEKVADELAARGLAPNQIGIIQQYLAITGSNETKLESVKNLLGNNETGKKGIEEIEYVLNAQFAMTNSQQSTPNTEPQTPNSEPPSPDPGLSLDLTLARGLNYYTGIIYEVKANNMQIGSIGGGGRYDDLTGSFGVPGIPGVGISFGIDRVYDVLEELKLFPETVETGAQVLFFNLGEKESRTAFALAQELRSRLIRCEIYHEQAKFDRQFKYAEKKHIPFAVIIGSTELENNTCVVKDLRRGEQHTIPQHVLAEFMFV